MRGKIDNRGEPEHATFSKVHKLAIFCCIFCCCCWIESNFQSNHVVNTTVLPKRPGTRALRAQYLIVPTVRSQQEIYTHTHIQTYYAWLHKLVYKNGM